MSPPVRTLKTKSTSVDMKDKLTKPFQKTGHAVMQVSDVKARNQRVVDAIETGFF